MITFHGKGAKGGKMKEMKQEKRPEERERGPSTHRGGEVVESIRIGGGHSWLRLREGLVFRFPQEKECQRGVKRRAETWRLADGKRELIIGARPTASHAPAVSENSIPTRFPLRPRRQGFLIFPVDVLEEKKLRKRKRGKEKCNSDPSLSCGQD